MKKYEKVWKSMTKYEKVWKRSSNPKFSALYYGVSICLVTFASAMAVVTLNIHHMGLRGKDVSIPDICSIFTPTKIWI